MENPISKKAPRGLFKSYLMSGGSEEELVGAGYNRVSIYKCAWRLEQAGARQRPRGLDGQVLCIRSKNDQKSSQKCRDYYRNHYIGSLRVDHKRPWPKDNLCELCGVHQRLSYHHWEEGDYSKGLYLCLHCHNFAELIDNVSGIATEYLKLKAGLDSLFVNPIALALTQQDWVTKWDEIKPLSVRDRRAYNRWQMRRYYLRSNVEQGYFRVEDKRPYPETCELCKNDLRMLKYHHWSENLSKGLWLCTLCHQLAEILDHTPEAEQRYLNLKGIVEQAGLQERT